MLTPTPSRKILSDVPVDSAPLPQGTGGGSPLRLRG